METVFLDRKGVVMLEFMQQGTTTTLEIYCETLKGNCIGPIGKNYMECSSMTMLVRI
jgi:hypothetical protein